MMRKFSLNWGAGDQIADLKKIGSYGTMSNTDTRNALEAGRFVGSAIGRNYPSEILDAAKCALSIGAASR